MFEDDFVRDIEKIKLKMSRIEEKLDVVLEFITRHGHGTPGLWAKGQPSHVQPGEPQYQHDKVMYEFGNEKLTGADPAMFDSFAR